MPETKDDPEQQIRAACAAQDHNRASTLALEAYGPELMAFLCARLRAQSDGEEAFSLFAEDLWKALPTFGFRCSVRAYMYTLARNAANRYAVAPHNRRGRHVTVTGRDSLSALVDRVRSATHVYQRTETKDRIRALREALPDEDQLLLILYIDRALPWREIAMVMHERGDQLEPDELERESARLRKRFERVKSELKELAAKDGLLDADH